MTDYFGRRRHIPEIYSPHGKDYEHGVREALNFKIQGPAASVLKIAMRRTYNALEGMRARIIMSVHDELVVECPQEELDKVVKVLYNMTTKTMPIELPVEVKVGTNWGEMHEYPLDRLDAVSKVL